MRGVTQNIDEEQVHLGINLFKVRRLTGTKQSVLAQKTGMSQQNISKLEQSAFIPDDTLEVLAQALGVTTDFIKNFNDENAVYNIQNNYDTSTNNHQHYQSTITYDPLEKVMELYEKQLKNGKEREELLEQRIKALEEIIVQLKKDLQPE